VKATSHSWTWIFTEDRMALWVTKCTASPLTPSNKQVVLSTLIHRARAHCDEDSLQAELVFLKDIFKGNGYNDRQLHRALKRRPLLSQPDSKPHLVAFLPFVGTVFNRISRVLA
jgi:hypothetical protein